MENFGRKYTEEREAAVKEGVAASYRSAQDAILDSFAKYGRGFEQKDEEFREKIQRGEATEKEREIWLRTKVFSGRKWKRQKDDTAELLYNANESATEEMNDEAPKVFSYNSNSTSYMIEKDYGVDMGLPAVGLVAAGALYKKRKLNKKKDKRWNNGNIEREVTSSILRTNSLNAITVDVAYNIVKRNRQEIERAMEDYIGGAESAGTLSAMEAAEAEGIGVLKQWIATLDKKTRDTHAILDGQLREIEEPFEVGPYEIMFPRDPEAAPEMRCNCRCTLGWEYKEYPTESMRRENIRNAEGVKPIVDDMTYMEWLEMKGFDDEY